MVSWNYIQGGGTPTDSVLRAATAVKVGQNVDRQKFHVDS